MVPQSVWKNRIKLPACRHLNTLRTPLSAVSLCVWTVSSTDCISAARLDLDCGPLLFNRNGQGVCGLGNPLQDFQQLDRPLRHNDLTVLELRTVEQSNGSVVQAQFESLATKYGVPLAILCDAGSDLKLGMRLFQERHSSTISSYDIVHLVSRKVEKIMNSTPQWDEFRKACCTCANALRQSKLAHLKPPCPRAKARYMKFGREIRWAARALWLLDRVQSGKLTEQQPNAYLWRKSETN